MSEPTHISRAIESLFQPGILTNEERAPRYHSNQNLLIGQRFVVADALFHLIDGLRTGWEIRKLPADEANAEDTHFFLLHKKTGHILDPIAERLGASNIPYNKGVLVKDTGHPSVRAKRVIDRIKDEPLSKGEFQQAGFRHIKTGGIYPTGSFHDIYLLPGGDYENPNDPNDLGGFNPDDYEAGFLDSEGKFYTRKEAAEKLGIHKEGPAGRVESTQYFSGAADPTEAGFREQWPEAPELHKAEKLVPGRFVSKSDDGNVEEWDYSHLLTEKAKQEGYKVSLRLDKRNKEALISTTKVEGNKSRLAGQLVGLWEDEPKVVHPWKVMVNESDRRKRLGLAMYEALYAHSRSKLGLSHVSGAAHSTTSHLVHKKVSKKYGLNYEAKPLIGKRLPYTSMEEWLETPSHDFDAKYGKYKYKLPETVDPLQKAVAENPAYWSTPDPEGAYLMHHTPGQTTVVTPTGNEQYFETPAAAHEYVRWHAKIKKRAVKVKEFGQIQKSEINQRKPIASIVVAQDNLGRILWGQRRKTGKYTLPAGHIQEGETPEQAAHRELYEEAGLKTDNLRYFGSGNSPEGPVCVYRCSVAGTPSTQFDPDREIANWEWHDCSNGPPSHITANLAHNPCLVHALMEWPQTGLEKAALEGAKKVGQQLGSNPGGVYEHEGQKYYYKFQPTVDHAKNEVLAAKLYEAAGHKVVPLEHLEDKVGTASAMLPIDYLDLRDPEHQKLAQPSFATHAWLANWDAAINENMALHEGQPITMDTGGALLYRAQGAPKGRAFGPTVGEWETLRDPEMNYAGHLLWGSMTPEALRESVKNVARVEDDTIDKLVAQYGPGDVSTKNRLAETLKVRKRDLVQRALAEK